MGLITAAVDVAVPDLAAKLLDAPNMPSAMAETSAARRKVLFNKKDVFIIIPS